MNIKPKKHISIISMISVLFFLSCSNDPTALLKKEQLVGAHSAAPENISHFGYNQLLRVKINERDLTTLDFKESEKGVYTIKIDFFEEFLLKNNSYDVDVKINNLNNFPEATWDYNKETKVGVFSWTPAGNFTRRHPYSSRDLNLNIVLTHPISNKKNIINRKISVVVTKDYSRPEIVSIKIEDPDDLYKKLEDGNFYRIPKNQSVNLRIQREDLEVEGKAYFRGSEYSYAIQYTNNLYGGSDLNIDARSKLRRPLYEKFSKEACDYDKYIKISESSNEYLLLEKYTDPSEPNVCYFEVNDEPSFFVLKSYYDKLSRVPKSDSVFSLDISKKNTIALEMKNFDFTQKFPVISEVFLEYPLQRAFLNKPMSFSHDVYRKRYVFPKKIKVVSDDGTVSELYTNEGLESDLKKYKFFHKLSDQSNCDFLQEENEEQVCYKEVNFYKLPDLKNLYISNGLEDDKFKILKIVDKQMHFNIQKIKEYEKLQLAGVKSNNISIVMTDYDFARKLIFNVRDFNFSSQFPKIMFEQLRSFNSLHLKYLFVSASQTATKLFESIEWSNQYVLANNDYDRFETARSIFATEDNFPYDFSKFKRLFLTDQSLLNHIEQTKIRAVPYAYHDSGDPIDIELTILPKVQTIIEDQGIDIEFDQSDVQKTTMIASHKFQVQHVVPENLVERLLKVVDTNYELLSGSKSPHVVDSLFDLIDFNIRGYFSFFEEECTSLEEKAEAKRKAEAEKQAEAEKNAKEGVKAEVKTEETAKVETEAERIFNNTNCACDDYTIEKSQYSRYLSIEANCYSETRISFDNEDSFYMSYAYGLKEPEIKLRDSIFYRDYAFDTDLIYLLRDNQAVKVRDLSRVGDNSKFNINHNRLIFNPKLEFNCFSKEGEDRRTCVGKYTQFKSKNVFVDGDHVELKDYIANNNYQIEMKCQNQEGQFYDCDCSAETLVSMNQVAKESGYETQIDIYRECYFKNGENGTVFMRMYNNDKSHSFLNVKEDKSLFLDSSTETVKFIY